MRTLCPNYDREDGLETVLEVPMPEEMFGSSNKNKAWHNIKSRWAREGRNDATSLFGGRNDEIQLLLGVLGAPLIPLPLHNDHDRDSERKHRVRKDMKNQPIEAAMARYIVKQYTAAVGGDHALDSIENMCATGKVSMNVSEFSAGEKGFKSKSNRKSFQKTNIADAVGGFVLWQKRPELWCLELVVSGYKISAGSDGRVAWRQTPWQPSHFSRGPSRPLRRFLQGLDPKSIATLFKNSKCFGEKTVNDEDCFILKLEADPPALRARSTKTVEIMSHTVWGCFSQKTGLLIQLEDSHLLRANSLGTNQSTFWETTMESLIQDYRTVDGVQIAHSGKTSVSLFRFGENSEEHSRTRMEEVWEIEDVDFNVKGLSADCFLAPADLMEEHEEDKVRPMARDVQWPVKRTGCWRISTSKVVAFDTDDESCDSDDLDGL